MRLRKAQGEALRAWIAEGLRTDEINARASLFDPPFEVKRSLVDYHRRRLAVPLKQLQDAGTQRALVEGLALRAERVGKLQALAELLEGDLFGERMWTRQVKGIGSGDDFERVEIEEFNGAEVQQYRGVLDDIAKEMGDRRHVAELTGKDGAPLIKAYVGVDIGRVAGNE